MHGPGRLQLVTFQFRYEFGFAEAVLGWMYEESAVDPSFKNGSCYFFEKEGTARLVDKTIGLRVSASDEIEGPDFRSTAKKDTKRLPEVALISRNRTERSQH